MAKAQSDFVLHERFPSAAAGHQQYAELRCPLKGGVGEQLHICKIAYRLLTFPDRYERRIRNASQRFERVSDAAWVYIGDSDAADLEMDIHETVWNAFALPALVSVCRVV